MTTARTHNIQVSPALGPHRARVATPKPENYVPPAVNADGELVGTDGLLGDTPTGEPYNPADHTIDEVKEHVTAHPEQADAILDAELDGKDRAGLTSWLTDFLDDEGEG